ncbi:MAG: HRDC domain-containing protein, partial [Fimbriimonadaceae bacterium]|nr:HRDC domain-containing protein [Alphaproteobacteria bacterium]
EAHPELAWKRLKIRVKKPKQIAVLIEVAAWREREAQRRDMPRGRVLKDEAIYEIAAQLPRNQQNLAGLRSVSAGLAKGDQGAKLLKAVERGLERDPGTVPMPSRPPRPVEGATATTDLLKVLCKKIAEDNKVAQRVIANVEDLEKIASDDNADVAALKGWRRELFGDTALALKRGEIGLAVRDGRVTLLQAPRN